MTHEEHVNNPRYRNWVKAGLALKYGKEIIQKLAENEIKTFRDIILSSCTSNFCDQCRIETLHPSRKRGASGGPSTGASACLNGVCNSLYQSIINGHNLKPSVH